LASRADRCGNPCRCAGQRYRANPCGNPGRRQRHCGARGLVQLRQVVELMDGGAESPQESRTRLLLIRSGLRQPETQIVVNDEFGYPFARIDLGWTEWKVASSSTARNIGPTRLSGPLTSTVMPNSQSAAGSSSGSAPTCSVIGPQSSLRASALRYGRRAAPGSPSVGLMHVHRRKPLHNPTLGGGVRRVSPRTRRPRRAGPTVAAP
jgi:hypothetical protein